MASAPELHVRKIVNGTVIDHITAGHALDVLRILQISGKEKYIISVAMNVPSETSGTKDIVKIESRELNPQEVNKIALIAPNATINIIRDYEVVDKKKVKLPETLEATIKCNNPSCITNAAEPVNYLFHVEKHHPIRLRCHYCNRVMEREDILKQF